MDKKNIINSFLRIKLILFFILVSLLLIELPCLARIEKEATFNVIDNKIEVLSKKQYRSRWSKRTYLIKEDNWSISFPSIKNQNKLLGPTEEVNGKVYFTYLSYILEFDIQQEKFVNRYQFLGEIKELSLNKNIIKIKTFDGNNITTHKEKEIEIPIEKLKDYSDLGIITNENNNLIYTKLNDAENLLEDFGKVNLTDILENKITPNDLGKLEKEYKNIIQRDITNPWNYIYLATIYKKLDKPIYSDGYYQKAVDVNGLVFYDYFQLGTFFYIIDHTTLSNIAFQLGFKDFLKRGYNPEQLTSPKMLLAYTKLFVYSMKKIDKLNIDKTINFFDFVYELSPFRENSNNILSEFTRYLTMKGYLPEAKKWSIRIKNNEGFFFRGDYSFLVLDLSFNLFISCMITAIFFSFMYLLQDFLYFYEDRRLNKTKGNDFYYKRYISKTSVFSLVLLYSLSLFALGMYKNTLSFVGTYTSKPITVSSGTWGNYSSVKYFEKSLTKSKEKNLFLGISYQQLKDFDQAIQFYQKTNIAESYNNLGVIYILKKDKESAILAFNKALSINKYLPEAKYNLKLMENSIKSNYLSLKDKEKTYYAYSPYQPILAFPKKEHYNNAFYPNLKLSVFSPINIFVLSKFLKETHDGRLRQYIIAIQIIFSVYSILIVFMLATLFIKRTCINTTNTSYIRRFIGLFLPGVSHNWKIFGSSIFAIWLTSGITNLFYYGYIYQNEKPIIGLVTNYAIPSTQFLNSTEKIFDIPYTNEISLLCTIIFFVLWIFNFFFVFTSERFSQ